MSIQKKLVLQLFIDPERQGTYFPLPFSMPEETESVTITYQYERRQQTETTVNEGMFTANISTNIIDLGLIAPDGTQIGVSGSNKKEITVNEVWATPGYRPTPLTAGEWSILVGAYKIAPEGVTVTYELTFALKHARLFKGDLHSHTLISDGVTSAQELAQRALRHGLDFIAVTDHNYPTSVERLPRIPGLTLIPGMEWTHYRGHANFLGVETPYEGSFYANTPEEVRQRFESAHARGAVININHPFDPNYGFHFDLDTLPYDCLEIWNGPMHTHNLQAIAYWHSLLVAGKKVGINGGSDYHHDELFRFPGGPCTGIYAPSASPRDLLEALRAGHAFISFAPDGPTIEMTAGDAILGDSVVWSAGQEVSITLDRLAAGDVARVITAQESVDVLTAPANGQYTFTFPVRAPGFVRVEVLRAFVPELPQLPALVSNPIYFDKES